MVCFLFCFVIVSDGWGGGGGGEEWGGDCGLPRSIGTVTVMTR